MGQRAGGFLASSLSRYTAALLLGGSLLVAAAAHGGELSPYAGQDSRVPVFALEALDGKPYRLEDYRGKVVLVNFWATWCPPCLAELPSMQRLADEMAGEAFTVLAINVGESAFRVARFKKLMGVRFTVLLDEKGQLFKAWGGTIYPTSFVLDTEGRIRYVAYGPLVWDDEDVVATLRGLLPPREAADQ